MTKDAKLDILILPEVDLQKYFDEDKPLPFEATPHMLKQALEHRLPGVVVEVATDCQEARRKIGRARILLADRLTLDMLEAATHVEWVQTTCTGADHFFKPSGTTPDDLKKRRITVLNSPGVSRVPTSEHVLALMLALSRGIHRATRQQMRHEWRIFCGSELCGKTCGIIGLGSIGSRVAELAKAFQMWAIGTLELPETYRGAADEVYGPDQNERIIREADFLVLACGLTAQTRGLMGHRQFRMMKPTAYLINVSRGENVDERALVDALRSGEIAGAALDVFGPLDRTNHKLMEALSPASELWDMQNVIITPNNAASSLHYLEYFADMVVENYRRAQAGEPFISQVV
jgi:phosphoglycerate dehydrogenase-like enzyme